MSHPLVSVSSFSFLPQFRLYFLFPLNNNTCTWTLFLLSSLFLSSPPDFPRPSIHTLTPIDSTSSPQHNRRPIVWTGCWWTPKYKRHWSMSQQAQLQHQQHSRTWPQTRLSKRKQLPLTTKLPLSCQGHPRKQEDLRETCQGQRTRYCLPPKVGYKALSQQQTKRNNKTEQTYPPALHDCRVCINGHSDHSSRSSLHLPWENTCNPLSVRTHTT